MPAPPGTPDFVCDKNRFFMARCIFQTFCIVIIHLGLSPLITGNADGNATDCIPFIRVPRNTMWKVRVKSILVINCTIVSESSCWENIDVAWCKIDDKNGCNPLTHFNHTATEWSELNKVKGEKLSHLIFYNVTMQDAGLYRCEIKSPTPSVSHSINVTVTDNVPDCTADNTVMSQETNTTKNLNSTRETSDSLPAYVPYICGGIGGLLLIMLVVSVTLIRRRGRKRIIKEKIHEDQSSGSPVVDLPPLMYTPRQPPRIKTQTLPAQLSPPAPSIYDTPPVRGRSLRDRSYAGGHHVNRGPLRRYDGRVAVQEEAEDNPLIYATLNHEAAPQRPAQRVAHVQIEASEYAAIKVT